MADKIGFRVTGNQCNQKYRNLLCTYRTNKQRASTTGTGSQAVKWPYFEIMDSVLGTKASSNPPLNSLVCSIRGVRGHQAQPEDEHYEEDVDDPQTSQQGPPSNKKKKNGVTMKEYLLFKMESEKEKLEKQEEENKEKARFKERELNIKEKQVEAILELTKAIGRGREEKK